MDEFLYLGAEKANNRNLQCSAFSASNKENIERLDVVICRGGL